MKRLLPHALAILAALFPGAQRAPAGALIYTNEADFVAATALLPTFLNDFTNGYYSGQLVHPLWSGNGSVSYVMSSVPLLELVAFEGAISTAETNDQIVVNFTSSNITAVGGLFYSADTNAEPESGTVTLLLSDGTTTNVDSVADAPAPFIGFISTGPLITSLIISNSAGGGYPALGHFYAVADPPPSISLSTAGSAVISWAATPTSYVLQVSPTLNGANWTDTGTTLQQVGGRVQALVSTSNTVGFFRLQRP